MNKPHNSYSHIKTHADAVIHFIQYMDIEMLDAILDENMECNNMPKKVFIKHLGKVFQQFKEAGDSLLLKYAGQCNAGNCHLGCPGGRFVGNVSGHYIDLLIMIEGDKVKDFCECFVFGCFQQMRVKNKRFGLGE